MTEKINIPFKGPNSPHYASNGAAGADLLAYIDKPISLLPGEYKLIPTGLRIALPECYEAQVRPRSGLAAKHGVTVLNTPGTIDSDYRGEIKVILINLGKTEFTIENGDRIAQMVIAPVIQGDFKKTDFLETTERGEGGFGSTGV